MEASLTTLLRCCKSSVENENIVEPGRYSLHRSASDPSSAMKQNRSGRGPLESNSTTAVIDCPRFNRRPFG